MVRTRGPHPSLSSARFSQCTALPLTHDNLPIVSVHRLDVDGGSSRKVSQEINGDLGEGRKGGR